MLDRYTLIHFIKDAAISGSLLTLKHDPNSGITYDKFRSVLTQEASGSLQQLIESEQYDFDVFYDKRHKKYSYKLMPYDSGSFTITGLGIPSGSQVGIIGFDSFLIVSGSSEGWHIYSENSDNLESKVQNSIIEYKGKI